MIQARRKITIALVFAGSLALLLTQTHPCQAEPKITPPKKIEYDGRILSYNPSWKNEEVYRETNLDEDPDPEIIIGFVAMYATPSEKSGEERRPFSVPEKELLPVYNYVFYKIYDMGPDKNYRLTKTFMGMDRPGQVYVAPLAEGRPPAIIFVSPGGTHYKDIAVYRWQEGGYRHLFDRGTSGEVTVIATPGEPKIILGKDTYAWEAEKGRFEKESPKRETDADNNLKIYRKSSGF